MAVSGHEATRTYDCKTPGCAGEARSRTGRHAYCLECRVARGTALPDGTPIEAKPQVVSRRRRGKPTGPFEERVLGLLDAARSLDLAVERYRLARPALDTAVAAWQAALADVAAAQVAPSPAAPARPAITPRRRTPGRAGGGSLEATALDRSRATVDAAGGTEAGTTDTVDADRST